MFTSASTLFQCPPGSQFVDYSGSLFGPNAVETYVSGWYYPVLTSVFQFSCSPCSNGLYVLEGGKSNGTVGGAVNPVCQVCPFGAVCQNGRITAAPGFWGSTVVRN